MATLLSRSKNPFFQHAEAEYFLAERGGEVVGRIAAIANRLHNETHGDRVGFFGFFECVDCQVPLTAEPPAEESHPEIALVTVMTEEDPARLEAVLLGDVI